MDNNNETKVGKIKWRLNMFDIIFIACALIAAVAIVVYSNRSGGRVAIIPAGTQETITYTVELQEMLSDAAGMIKPGDELIDKIEKRPMGTVVAVTLEPSTRSSRNTITGERIITDFPGRTTAVITVQAEATVTESQISIGRFVVRIGTRVSVNGPLYYGNGYITDMERSDG
jgi:hypothetical protein